MFRANLTISACATPAIFATAILATLACMTLAGCAPSEPGMVVDRVHDLVTLADRVEINGRPGTDFDSEVLVSIEDLEDRDALAVLRAFPGSTLYFRNLRTSGKATLHFGCGVASPKEALQNPGAVRMRIQVAQRNPSIRVDHNESDFKTIFEEVYGPNDFPEPDLYNLFDKVLVKSGEWSWDLKFTCERMESKNKELPSWSGWIRPRLVSDGRRVSLTERPLQIKVKHGNLIHALNDAEIIEQRSDLPVKIDTYNASVDDLKAGGDRLVIAAAAPSHISFTVVPPEDAVFEFSVGMDNMQGWDKPGDGMTFAVKINGERIWSLCLDAYNIITHRGWKPVSLDLSPWAGQEIRLDLITQPGEDPANDVGGWAYPCVMHSLILDRKPETDETPFFLLVVAETLRYDRLGVYGYEAARTPHLDAMAREGVLFTQARSASSWTWPSVASILTGLYPNSHGVQHRQQCYLVESIDSLPEIFLRRGYTTAAFMSNVILSRDNNFQQGFETYVYTPHASARALNERFRHWLDNTQGVARFAYLHYLDPHDPYLPPPAFFPKNHSAEEFERRKDRFIDRIRMIMKDENLESDTLLEGDTFKDTLQLFSERYDAEIAYLDTAIGEMLKALEDRGILDNCVIVFVSDHGEEFYEHKMVFHGYHLFDESIRVPLWITGYGKASVEPRVISASKDTKDLAPTLCELAGFPLLDVWDLDSSLLKDKASPNFAHTQYGLLKNLFNKSEIMSFTQGDWKLILTPDRDQVELYNLKIDPMEQVNRSGDEPAIRNAMLKALKDWYQATLKSAPDNRLENNKRINEQLRALGYIGD